MMMTRALPLQPPAEVAPRREHDLVLARRCIDGDRDAQRTLFQRELSRVHRILYRLTGGGHQLEDLTQEAFLALFRSLPSYRGEAQLSTWVDRITVRVGIAHLERKRRTIATAAAELGELTADTRSMEHTLAQRAAAQRLYAALDKLDARQRVAFVLHVVEDYSMAEVATMMGATRVATKARVWRARRELERRARLDPALAALFAEGGMP